MTFLSLCLDIYQPGAVVVVLFMAVGTECGINSKSTGKRGRAIQLVISLKSCYIASLANNISAVQGLWLMVQEGGSF